MSRIAIMGGAGFIGGHLVEKLLNEGNEVVVYDNLSTGNFKNIADFFDNKNFSFIGSDISDKYFSNQIYSLKFDEIYNLACPASPLHYKRIPVETWKASVFGISNLLQYARFSGSRVLQASTSEIYGDPIIHPQLENYNGNVDCIGIRSPYDEGKRAAETLCYTYLREYDTDVVIVRIFNTYGPRLQKGDGRVISNFIVQSLKNQDLTVYGNGQQTRSFCFVKDTVDGLVKAMNTKGFHGPVNIGNPQEITIYDLAVKIIGLTKSSSKIIFDTNTELREGDPDKRCPDITLAQEILKWSPATSLEDGLEKTIKWFRKDLG